MPRPGPIKPQPGGPQFNPFGGLMQRLTAAPPSRPPRGQYSRTPSRKPQGGPNTGIGAPNWQGRTNVNPYGASGGGWSAPRPAPPSPSNPLGGLMQRLTAAPPNRPPRSQDPTTAYRNKPNPPSGSRGGFVFPMRPAAAAGAGAPSPYLPSRAANLPPSVNDARTPAAAINRARSVRALPAAVAAATATAGSPGGVAPTGPARPAPIPPQAPAPPAASPVPAFPPPPTAAATPPPPAPTHPAQAFADRAVAEVAGANQARRDTPAAPVASGGKPGALPSADNPQGVAAPGRSLQNLAAPEAEATTPGTGNPVPSRLEQALSGVTAANSGGGLSQRDSEAMQFYNKSGYAKDLRSAADNNLSQISNQAMRNALVTGEAFTPVNISALNAPIVTGFTPQEADWDRTMTAYAGAGETMPLGPGAAAYLQSGDAGNMLGGRRGDEIPGELANLGFRDPNSLPPLQPGAYTPAINLGLAYQPHTNEAAFQPRVPWQQMQNLGQNWRVS